MSIHEHSIQYQESTSTRSYEELVAAFEAAVGNAEAGEVTRAFEDAEGAENGRERWESGVNALFGPSGFVRVFSLDHGVLVGWYGKKAKAKTWIYGNPIIAETMLRHDIRVGGWLPLQILIFEGDNGEGRVIFDLPSSVLARFGNDEIDAAARKLDIKLQAFVAELTGTEV